MKYVIDLFDDRVPACMTVHDMIIIGEHGIYITYIQYWYGTCTYDNDF